MNSKHIFWACCLLFLAGRVQAQGFKTSGEIYEDLQKLKVLGSVLYIAAHPDDENTRLITWLSRDRHYRTGYLSMTRGDGGQNLIGEEQGPELGLLRTQELLSARRIDGAYQFFTRALDFGYSKTPEETFRKWDHDKILSDVVWVIRQFQPDIIITRFPTTGEGGHGHHTASAILANEAFLAAADPRRFPEQLKYVQVWKTKRILFNHFNFGNTQPPAEAFKVDVGGFNPVLGKSYGEIASLSRSQHKSQGFGSALSRGESFEAFKLTDGEPLNGDLLSGVNTGWSRIAGGARYEQMIAGIISKFDFSHPQNSVPALLSLYAAMMQDKSNSKWLDWKRDELRQLIADCSSLFMEASAPQPYIVGGQNLPLQLSLNDRSGVPLRLSSVSLLVNNHMVSQLPLRDTALQANRNFVYTVPLTLTGNEAITQPYWLEHPWEDGRYDVRDQLMIGKAENDPPVQLVVELGFFGSAPVKYVLPVRFKSVDQVKGELYQPFRIYPASSVEPVHPLEVVLQNKTPDDMLRVQGFVKQDAVAVYQSGKAVNQIPALDANEVSQVQEPGPQLRQDTVLHYSGQAGQPYYTLHQIRYDHVPNISYFLPAQSKWVFPDVKTSGKQIGYIVGAGDKVPEALTQMGYQVTLLGQKELENMDLGRFDAIITGIRAFNTNPWMDAYYNKLMEYVKNGGNYIVQYSQSNNIRARIAPYPLTLSNKRITDETADVKFLLPDHPVLNWPNKIGPADFEGWVQERSIYHGTTSDPHYQAILRMRDPGEGDDDGALLIAPYGKGYFSYCGLVLFRELPMGVPGAYRILANLIALNRKQEF